MRSAMIDPLVLLMCIFCPPILRIRTASNATHIDAASFGVKADGTTDDTAAIQKALDAAGQQGGVVRLPAGKYLVAGSLKIPAGVALVGSNQAPVYIEPLIGTVILATGGRDKEDAPALFELGDSATVQGLTVFYPDQKPDDIHPYAWTFHLQGGDNTVENVTSDQQLQRHQDRSRAKRSASHPQRLRLCLAPGNLAGLLLGHRPDRKRPVALPLVVIAEGWRRLGEGLQVHVGELRRIRVCQDRLGIRHEHVHLSGEHRLPVHCHGARGDEWSTLRDRGRRHQSLYRRGRDPADGSAHHQRPICRLQGENPIEIVINPTCTGSVRLQNCNFWGPAVQNVVSHSQSFVSLSNCYFSSGKPNNPGKALVEADGGKLQVQGCSFATPEPSILLGKGLKHAIVTGNNGVRGVTINNQIGDQAIISGNEPSGQKE